MDHRQRNELRGGTPGIVIDWSPRIRAQCTRRSRSLRHGLPVRFNDAGLPRNPDDAGGNRQPGEVITPELYAQCFKLCRDAESCRTTSQTRSSSVRSPWNTQTIYGSNANGDWVTHLRHSDGAGASRLRRICATCIHAGPPDSLRPTKPPPFQSHHVHFRTYRDFLSAVPVDMRHLAIYITEADQSEPWLDNTGGCRLLTPRSTRNQQAENQRGGRCYFTVGRNDRWHIEGKAV